MGNLRDRAQRVREAGEQERGNFQPRPGNITLRIYKYWRRYKVDPPKRENFCHFLRVVLFWAPLTFVGRGLARMFDATWFKVGLGAVVAASVLYLLVSTGSIAVVGGVVGAALALLLVVSGVVLAFDRWWPREWNAPLANFAGKAILALLAVGLVGLVGLLVFMGVAVAWYAPLLALAFVGALVGLFILLDKLSTYISGRRALRREKHYERLSTMSSEEYYDYMRESAEPGRLLRFFSGAGDLFIFVFQVVRVKKWKICPIVTIPEED